MENKVTKKLNLTIFDSALAFDVLVLLMLIFSLLYTGLIKNFNLEQSAFIKVLAYLPAPLSVVLLVPILSFRKRENILSVLTPKKPKNIYVLAMLLITVGMTFGLSEVNSVFVNFLSKLGLTVSEATLPNKTPLNVILVIVFVCVFPSFFEEIAFRGIILNGLKNGGKWFAVLVSGALFSLFHMSPAQTVYQFIVGVLYALIVLGGGDWTLTFISHFINNLFIVLNYYFIKFYPTGALKIILTVLGLICLACGVLILLKNSEKIDKTENKKNYLKSFPIGLIVCVFMWIVGLL